MWARPGWRLLGLSGGLALPLWAACLLSGKLALGLIALIPTAFLLLFLTFFRDPERVVGPGVVAPADGRVSVIREEGSRVRIGTFMNVHNVHVNRYPVAGYLVRVEDRGGPKRPAFSPDAEGNSQKRYLLGTPLGLVEVVQITGIVARRCVAYREASTPCRKGDRFGMIVFGSRVDVVLPRSKVRVLVRPGQKVRAGCDTLAEAVP